MALVSVCHTCSLKAGRTVKPRVSCRLKGHTIIKVKDYPEKVEV